MVLDASALLALVFNEPHAPWVLEQMELGRDSLIMGTVNLAEVLILLRDRQPSKYATIERRILKLPIKWIAPSVEHAQIVSSARIRFSIHLGHCFAYALARTEDQPLLTLDGNFKKTDLDLIFPD